MRANETAYPFSAFSKTPTCAAADHYCDRLNFFAVASNARMYARAYVLPQSYSNCAPPTAALRQGTFFNDLAMPYLTLNPCCKEASE